MLALLFYKVQRKKIFNGKTAKFLTCIAERMKKEKEF